MVNQLTHAIIYTDIISNLNLLIKYNGEVIAGNKYQISIEYIGDKPSNKFFPLIEIQEQSKVLTPIQETKLPNKLVYSFYYNAPYIENYILNVYPIIDKKKFYIPIRIVVQIN
jgi:hypothetical protein